MYVCVYIYIYIYIYNSNNDDVVHGNRIDKTDLNYLAFTFFVKNLKQQKAGKENNGEGKNLLRKSKKSK